MERLTQYSAEGKAFVSADNAVSIGEPALFFGTAVDRLAAFENLLEDLFKEQEQIAAQLEELRRQERTKSVRFRELMGQKMFNTGVLNLFERNRLL